jgi:hypothetical protein
LIKAPQKNLLILNFWLRRSIHITGKKFLISNPNSSNVSRKTRVKNFFMMEENFQSEEGINEWISGGNGSKATITQHFSIDHLGL